MAKVELLRDLSYYEEDLTDGTALLFMSSFHPKNYQLLYILDVEPNLHTNLYRCATSYFNTHSVRISLLTSQQPLAWHRLSFHCLDNMIEIPLTDLTFLVQHGSIQKHIDNLLLDEKAYVEKEIEVTIYKQQQRLKHVERHISKRKVKI